MTPKAWHSNVKSWSESPDAILTALLKPRSIISGIATVESPGFELFHLGIARLAH